MMGLRKWLGLCEHEWTKWETDTSNWTRSSMHSSHKIEFTKITQTRMCKICGRLERNVIFDGQE